VAAIPRRRRAEHLLGRVHLARTRRPTPGSRGLHSRWMCARLSVRIIHRVIEARRAEVVPPSDALVVASSRVAVRCEEEHLPIVSVLSPAAAAGTS
jgi:hypothetical protein